MEKEIELLKRAKIYIDSLANGVNPFDGTTLPENDIVNNIKISRCLFYVSSILEQNLANIQGSNKTLSKPTLEFSITAEQLKGFEFSSYPIGIARIIAQINTLIDSSKMKKLSPVFITNWIEELGYITRIPYENTKRTIETELGRSLGITTEERTSSSGRLYLAVLYNQDAQKFIITNLPKITK